MRNRWHPPQKGIISQTILLPPWEDPPQGTAEQPNEELPVIVTITRKPINLFLKKKSKIATVSNVFFFSKNQNLRLRFLWSIILCPYLNYILVITIYDFCAFYWISISAYLQGNKMSIEQHMILFPVQWTLKMTITWAVQIYQGQAHSNLLNP